MPDPKCFLYVLSYNSPHHSMKCVLFFLHMTDNDTEVSGGGSSFSNVTRQRMVNPEPVFFNLYAILLQFS